MKKYSDRKNIDLILSGQHPKAKKYAGRHVLVIKDQILPLKKGKKTLKEIDRLEKKYGETPILVFVPRQDISYILILCLR